MLRIKYILWLYLICRYFSFIYHEHNLIKFFHIWITRNKIVLRIIYTGSDLPGEGVGGFNPPNDFLTPESPSIWAPGGSILTPLLHVSACGASTLSPVGDPPNVFFSQIGHCIYKYSGQKGYVRNCKLSSYSTNLYFRQLYSS